MNEDTECPICYELYSDELLKYRIEPCNHVCCEKCIERLRVCFYCRGPIPGRVANEVVDIAEEVQIVHQLPEEIANAYSAAFRRRRNLTLELTYFLINYCNCSLTDIENNGSYNYGVQKIIDYIRSNNYLHSEDRRYILLKPELKNLLIREYEEREIDKREMDENGNSIEYITFYTLQRLLHRRNHFNFCTVV